MVNTPAMKTDGRINRREFVMTAVAGAAAFPAVLRGAAADGIEIGLVADAQYADADPKKSRFYRKSLARLQEAVEHFEGRRLAWCAHLGDLIDHDWASFDAITRPLLRSRHRWHHLLGNHDFTVEDSLKLRVPGRLGLKRRHYSIDTGAFTFVVLDTGDVSLYAHPAGSSELRHAEAELARLQAANVKQARPWNGAVGPAQLAWMEQVCRDAARQQRRVIVLAHHPVAPEATHNVWNPAEVLAVVERNRNVVAWINGHNHDGAFEERFGVPFVTMHGMVETENTTAFATARFLSDRVVISGHGREPSRELKFRAA